MKSLKFIPFAIAMGAIAHAQAIAEAEAEAPATAPAAEVPAAAETQAEENKETAEKSEKEKLAEANALADEKLKNELAATKAELSKIKLEKELLSEKLSLETLKLRLADQEQATNIEVEKAMMQQMAMLSKAEAENATHAIKAREAELQMEIAELQSDIKILEAEKNRATYADQKPQYLENPLLDDGKTLIISDRRIALNGPISYDTADYVTERLSFFNNKDQEKPIFIVIDNSPGGSVMAGYRILKAMEESDAPIYVVVKSFAASMAAAITTLAEQSFAYPNALILHHQISMTVFGRLNLTQQKEMVDQSQRWWKRFAQPIADKMGVTLDEFIEQMYAKDSSGDWVEFAEQAVELKWVDQIVENIKETSVVRNPDVSKTLPTASAIHGLTETLDDKGRPIMIMPRLYPMDAYWMINPDGYYRLP